MRRASKRNAARSAVADAAPRMEAMADGYLLRRPGDEAEPVQALLVQPGEEPLPKSVTMFSFSAQFQLFFPVHGRNTTTEISKIAADLCVAALKKAN